VSTARGFDFLSESCVSQAARTKKAADHVAKAVQKNKDAGKAMYNKITIPNAKFEADFIALRSMQASHVLLPEVADLLAVGDRIKKQAAATMESGEALTLSGVDLQAWLLRVRLQSKVIQTMIKTFKK
jgi:hypothetical protein